jgi:uncharacterized repeat protein (TIGR01451 family)
MVAEGVLTPEQAENHPRRHVLSRSIGTKPDVEVDLFNSPFVPGDRVLLCSDGLTEYVTDAEILDAMQAGNPETAAQQLVDWANARGGQDNITVLIVQAVPERQAHSVPAVPSQKVAPTPPPRRNRFWPLLALVAIFLIVCAAGLGVGWLFWFGPKPEADLAVEKAVGNPSPKEGEQIVYTITVTNLGPDRVEQVVVTDTLPVGVTYVLSNASQGAYQDVTGAWDVGFLDHEMSAALSITVTIDPGTAGTTMTNVVTVAALDAQDPNLENNVDDVSIDVASAQAALERNHEQSLCSHRAKLAAMIGD